MGSTGQAADDESVAQGSTRRAVEDQEAGRGREPATGGIGELRPLPKAGSTQGAAVPKGLAAWEICGF